MTISAPTDLSDCQLWLDANTGLYQDSAGTTPAGSGDPVGRWSDQSGNSRHVTQPTTSRKPTAIGSAVPNSNGPTVRFDGSDDALDVPNFLTGYTAGEAFLVCKAANDPSTFGGAPLQQWGSSGSYDHYPERDGIVYSSFGSGALKTTGDPAADLSAYHVLNLISAPSDWQLLINGVAHYTTTSNTVGWGSAPKISWTSSFPSFEGDIAEVIFYSRKLSTSERADVLDYLDAKWFTSPSTPTYVGSGGLSVGGDADSLVTFSYVGSGGLLVGGDAEEGITKYNYVGSGGLLVGGDAEEGITKYNYVGSDGLSVGGDADSLVTFSYVGSGGLSVGGDADSLVTFSYVGSGGLSVGGDAEEGITKYNYVGSGGLSVGGDAEEGITKYNYVGSGGLLVGGDAEEAIVTFRYNASGGLATGGDARTAVGFSNPGVGGGITLTSSPFNPTIVRYEAFFQQTISWDVERTISRDLDLVWNTGPSDLFFFRIECECLDSASDPCDSLNFDPNDPSCGNNPLGGQTTVKYIAATDPTDLCEKLKRGFITQPFSCKIKKVQRFTRPVDKRRIEELELTDACNRLIDVPIDNVQECLDFNVNSDLVQTIGFTMRAIDSITTLEGSGGFTIGGSAEAGVVPPSATGDGGLSIGGSAEVTSTHWSYSPDAETATLIISGQGLPTFFEWFYDGTGGIDIGGEAEVVSPYHSYEANSGISLAGQASLRVVYSYTPVNPQIVIGGSSNAYQVTQEGSGGVSIGGEAEVTSSAYSYEGSGGLSLSEEAGIVSSAFSWQGSGGLALAGNGTPVWRIDGSGGFGIGGEADVTLSYSVESEGGLSISGQADVISPHYSHVASGGLTAGGDISTNFLGTFDIEMGMEMRVTDLGVTFGVTEGKALTIGTTEVISPCGCGNIPQVLQMRHNFILSHDLSSFLSRNGFTLPGITTLTYKQRTRSWSRNFHYTGVSPSSTGVETWDVFFEFLCTDVLGGEILQTSIWKFCAFFRQRNLTTGADDDSRIIFTFPSTDVCPTGTFQRLDYSFSYDTQSKTLLTSTGASGTNIVVNDGIKLFSSRAWQLSPDLDIRITAVEIEDPATRIDITPLFPFDPTAPLLTTTSN